MNSSCERLNVEISAEKIHQQEAKLKFKVKDNTVTSNSVLK
jgi:hypothetical protein